MNVLGQPLATYGPSKVVVGIFAFLAAGAIWLAWSDLHRDGPDKADGPFDAAIHLAVAVPLAAVALWMSRRRVVLYPEGLSYSSLFAEKQIRWDDLQRFYYRATRRSVNFIPIGTYYWFQLVDSQGQKVRFGTGLAEMASLANKLLELTQRPLLNRIVSQFGSGADVDFGPIRVNRQSGIVVKKSWGRLKHIPWNELQSYAIQRGHFYIWRAGEKRTTGPAIAKVPNAFALLGLLNIIFKPPDPSVRS
jgi:uncharacterized protein DUF6585